MNSKLKPKSTKSIKLNYYQDYKGTVLPLNLQIFILQILHYSAKTNLWHKVSRQ